MRGRFSRLPAAAVMDLRLSAEALRVLAVLGCYADKTGYCWPAVTTMARRLGLHRTTVQRHLRKLEGLGYVDRTETMRATRGGWGRNRYGLNYPEMPADSLADGDGDLAPEHNEGNGANPASELQGPIGSDAAPQAASAPEFAATMLHQIPSDAAPDAPTDAAPHAAQTIPSNYPTEKEPSGSAHVRSRRDGVIVYQDGPWEPDPETPSPEQAPVAQQVKSPIQAPSKPWKPKRSAKPKDHTTEMAKHLAVLPGFDRAMAWEAILALPSDVQERLELGDLHVTELLDALQDLDVGDTAKWRRAQDGLTRVAGAE